MANTTSQHILGTSANLLGFCLFVITSLHIANSEELKFINIITSLIALMLALSCFFSFASIRTQGSKREKKMELIADYLFIVSLVGILITIFLITMSLL